MFAQGWKSDYSLAEQLQQYFNGNSTNLADDDYLLYRVLSFDAGVHKLFSAFGVSGGIYRF